MDKPEQVLALRQEQENYKDKASEMRGLESVFISIEDAIDKAFESREKLRILYIGQDPYSRTASEAEVDLEEGERLKTELRLALGSYRRWIAESRQKIEDMHYDHEIEVRNKADALASEFTPEESRAYRELLSQPKG